MTEAGAKPSSRGRRLSAPVLLSLATAAVAAVALFLTWRRLFVGMDLQDESYYVLVPWRWALGDRPFVNEQNIAQVSGVLEYPFVKLFALVRHNDATGLVLYDRHLYLLLMVVVALAAFLVMRKILRWQLALLVGAVLVTFIFWQTPQLSYNTMGAAFLALGTALGLPLVLGRPVRPWALASGAAFALATIAYPTFLFIMPFYAIFLAFAMGRRSVAMIAEFAFARPPDRAGPPTGHDAWRALSYWVLGGVAVLVPFAALFLSFGVRNLERCWAYSMDVARAGGQLGGAAKAVAVVQGFWRLTWSRPYLVVAALLVYLVFVRWPRLGRSLLVLLPVALWLAGQRDLLNGAGFVIMYVLLAPYLYLFVPRERREVGAKLLYWVWAPSILAGAMTAFTSAAGYANSPVGLLPGVLASGVFLAWSLEALAGPEPVSPHTELDPGESSAPTTLKASPVSRFSFVAFATLAAVLAVTILFQFQFQQRAVPYGSLSRRFDFGPWWGIKVTQERYSLLRHFDADLQREALPGDQLLIFYQACGYYLFWDGGIAANSYWLSSEDVMAPLPPGTVSYYRRHRLVPTLAVHLLSTQGLSDAQLQAGCGGLGYPPSLVRPLYAFQRKPSDETTLDVLIRLPH